MNINRYSRAKGSSNTTRTVTTVINGGTIENSLAADKLSSTHTIFGHPFNGTQDVEGDITATDGTFESINAEIGLFDDCTVGELTATDGTFTNVDSNNITTTELFSQIGKVTNLTAEKIVSDTASIKNLTVTGKAEFFELIIDKVKAAGGSLILSPADGFTVEKVEVNEANRTFYLYWKATDGEKAISNMWKAGDLAICLTFNAATGTNYNTANKYYWSLVYSVGTKEIDNTAYHYIEIDSGDNREAVGTVEPEVGDEIALLGSRASAERGSAIYISAYNSIDSGLTAPLFCLYEAIDSFNLSAYRKSYFAANGNSLLGNLLVESGRTVEELCTTTENLLTATNQGVTNWEGWDESKFDIVANDSNGGITVNRLTTGSTMFLADFSALSSDLKAGDKYTVSFKSTYNRKGVGLVVAGRVKNSSYKNYCADTTSTIMEDNLCRALITITEDFSDAEVLISLYGTTDVTEFDIWDIKLEKGWNYFPKFSYNPIDIINTTNTVAQLAVTNDEIIAKVNDVSLKVDEWKVTIDGDTEIKGNLLLTSGELGFTLLNADSGAITQISPKSVGTVDSFLESVLVDTIYSHTGTENVYNSTATVVITYDIGYLTVGSVVKVADLVSSIRKSVDISSSTINSVSAELYCKNSLYISANIIGSTKADTFINFNTTAAGNYSIKLVFNVTATSAHLGTTFEKMPTVIIDSKIKVSTPATAYTLIGNDGIASNLGAGNCVHISSNGTYISYGSYSLLVNNEGIFKKDDTKFVPLNRLTTKVVSGATVVDDGSIDFYSFSSGTNILKLPTATDYNGKVIKVRRASSATLSVTTASGIATIILSGNTSSTATYSVGSSVYDFSIIAASGYWYIC